MADFETFNNLLIDGVLSILAVGIMFGVIVGLFIGIQIGLREK